MRAQGAVEYILILGVIILIALIVIVVLPNISNFKFITQTEARINDIQNLLSDVALQQRVNEKGFIQANLMTMQYSYVLDASLTVYSELNQTCNLTFGTVRSGWSYNSTTCDFINGSAGETYVLKCVVSYTEPTGVTHNQEGVCRGIFEDS